MKELAHQGCPLRSPCLSVTKRFMRRLLQILSVSVLLIVGRSTAIAQSSAQELFSRAEETLQSGDPGAAAKLYEQLIRQFPTFEGLGAVKYNLALAWLYSENHEKAVAQFKELAADSNKDAPLREEASLGLGSAQTTLARTQSDSAARLRILGESIQSFETFLKKFPQSTSRGEALLGKAASEFYAERYDDTLKTLSSFATVNAAATLRNEATYLQGRTLAAQAGRLREQKRDHEARETLEHALVFFDQVAENTQNAVAGNDALFTAGEALFQMGFYREAIRYLRRIQSKSFLEKEQSKIVDSLRKEYTQAMTGSNRDVETDFHRRYVRAASRLREIQTRPALHLNAQLVIAQCLYEQGKYDETVLLSQHYLPFYDPEQKRRAVYYTIKALLQNDQQIRAVQTYQDYKKQNPGEQLGEDSLLSLADFFYRKKRFPDCLEWLREYQTVFPHGKLADTAALLEINIYTSTGELDKAWTSNEEFRQRFQNSPLETVILYNRAYLNYAKKEYHSALTDFRDFTAKFPKSENFENARFFTGICLRELKRSDDALQTFEAFEKDFPKSKLFANSIFHRAKAWEDKGDPLRAIECYTRLLKEFPNDELAPFALFGMARAWAGTGNTGSEKALPLFDEFISKYDKDPLAPSAYLYKGSILRHSKRLEEALTTYNALIDHYPDNPAAAEALILVAELNLQTADRMAARPERLSPDRIDDWKLAIGRVQSSCEKALRQFPKDGSADKALSLLVQIWQRRVEAGLCTKEEAKTYFNQLTLSSDPAIRVKISFALGGLMERLHEKLLALQTMTAAYDKAGDVSLPNEGYQQYRKALIDARQFDRAVTISERQRREKEENHDPAGVAEAVLGVGQIQFEKGDFPKASEAFHDVLDHYAWHETAAPQAEFFLGWIEEKQNNHQEAIKLYNALLPRIRDTEMRVQVFFRLGYAWYGRFEQSPDQKLENLRQSLAYFLKIGTAFSSFPTYASESLYMAASLYEQMAVLSPDARGKTEGSQNAVKFYKRCLDEFPTTPWAQKSKERLGPLAK